MKENWEYKKFGEVFKLTSGDYLNSKEIIQGNYPIYGGNGIIAYHNKFNLNGENLIIGRVGALCGNARFIREPIWLTDNAFKLNCDTCLFDLQFLTYLLNYKNLRSYARQAAQPVISNSSLKDVEIPLPPLEEQKRIVKILNEKFTQLETVKANAKANLQNAKDLFQSKLTKAFSNTNWEKKTVLEVCTNIVDCPHTTPKKAGIKTDFPCIRTSELKDGYIFWDSMQYLDKDEYEKRIARLQPQENDIVFGREGSVGGAVLLPAGYHFSLGQRTMLLRPDQKLIYPKYFLQVIISDFFRKQIREKMTPGGVAHINVADVKILNVLLPPLPEQKRIVGQLDSLSEKVRSLEEIYTKQLANCDELKQSLLKKAFDGEL